MNQFWAVCEIFGKMDQQRIGAVRRVDFLWATREFGTDVEFRKVLRKLDLAGRFYQSAKDLRLEELISLMLPRATTVELSRVSRWADLWKVRHALETCGLKDDPDEIHSLFTVLDEAGEGKVALRELARSQILSNAEIMHLLPAGRGYAPLSNEEFSELIAPELRTKYRCQEAEFDLKAIKSNLSKRDVFKKILTMITASNHDISESPRSPCMRRHGLPQLPCKERPTSRHSSSLSTCLGKGGASPPVDAQTEIGRAETPRTEPTQRFETLRARRARAICTGGGDDTCLQKYEFLRNCTPLFLSFLFDELQCEMFKPGDLIIREGVAGDKVYLLRRGEVEVLVGPDLARVAQLKEGVAFGEMALFDSTRKRCATVRATTVCDCRTLNQRTFHKLLQCFPDDKEYFKSFVHQRKAELQKVRETCGSQRARSTEKRHRSLLQDPSALDTVKGPLVPVVPAN